jgi:hypothetical protein
LKESAVLSNSDLWQRIQGFEIDNPNDELPFTSRLACEYGWSHEKARDAIGEYKKFIYLICVSASPLTPSEVVDQVWHCHVLDTRSYWTGLCEGVLGRPIHHDPTEGGGARTYHVLDQYAETRSVYESEFGRTPPAEFWPFVTERFAATPVRQETARTSGWIAPKPSGYGSILWCSSAALLALSVSSEDVAAAVQPDTLSSSSPGPMLVLAGVVGLMLVLTGAVGLSRLIGRGLRRTPEGADRDRSAGARRRGYSGDPYWGCSG